MENLVKNVKFWVAVIALVTVVLAQFVAGGFAIDAEAAAAQIIVLVVYLLGVIKDPGGSGWMSLVKSRKFWTALVTEAALWLTAFGIQLPAGITYDTIIEIIVAITGASFISGFANQPPKTAAPCC